MKSQSNDFTTIYKYTPHNNCCKYNIIRHCELWFADIKSLNDPMDLNLAYRQHYSDDEIRQYWENLAFKNPKRNLQSNLKQYGNSKSFVEYRKEQLNKSKAKIGVLCMSKCPSNILMWSHYADAHKGIVYGFDENLFKDSDRKHITKNPLPMDYCSKYKLLSYAQVGDDNTEQLKKLLTLKAEDWDYENEVRFISINKGGVAINFNPKCLKYIIFGANTQKQEIDKVKNLCRENGKLNDIRFKQTEFVEGRFELRIKPIE